MEIKSNILGIPNSIDKYDIMKSRLHSVREDIVNILTDVDDCWVGRSGDSFKYICWYLKLLLDTGYDELDNLRNEIIESKNGMHDNDNNLSHQIIMNA